MQPSCSGELLHRDQEVLPKRCLLHKQGCHLNDKQANYHCDLMKRDINIKWYIRCQNISPGGLQLPGRDWLLQSGQLLRAGILWVDLQFQCKIICFAPLNCESISNFNSRFLSKQYFSVSNWQFLLLFELIILVVSSWKFFFHYLRITFSLQVLGVPAAARMSPVVKQFSPSSVSLHIYLLLTFWVRLLTFWVRREPV